MRDLFSLALPHQGPGHREMELMVSLSSSLRKKLAPSEILARRVAAGVGKAVPEELILSFETTSPFPGCAPFQVCPTRVEGPDQAM